MKEETAYQITEMLIEASKTGHVGKGYCHILWGCKKQILKERFNIDWRSPQEMNPHCRFD